MEQSGRVDSDVSADALASQLSGSLPLYVPADVVDKYPQLSHLLEDLTHRLTPTGIHKTTYAKLLHASYAMKHAREAYLEKATLHRLAEDVLYETSQDHRQTSKDLEVVMEALTLSELQDHLKLVECKSMDSCSDDQQDVLSSYQQSQRTIFGITPEQLLARAEMKASDQHTEKLASAIEKKLEREWDKMASFMDPAGYSMYDLEQVVKIPVLVEDTKRKVAEERNKLIHSMTQTDCLFQQVYSLLLEYGKVLLALMSKQRLSHYLTQHLSSCTVTLSIQLQKLRCIQLEILVDTYTSKSVPALKLLHSHLEERTSQAEKSLARLKHEMSSYTGLDSRFQELLQEYAKLQEDVEFTKCSTQEFVD